MQGASKKVDAASEVVHEEHVPSPAGRSALRLLASCIPKGLGEQILRATWLMWKYIATAAALDFVALVRGATWL
eukprot:5875603-Alexandrium_andersonii.AAC.1